MKSDIFLRTCFQFLNLPYIYGGKNPLQGEDCSGLVCELLKSAGLIGTNDEFSAQELYDKFKSIGTPYRKQGSLMWFGGDVSNIIHVALCLDDTSIIEAGHGSSNTNSKADAEDRGAYVRIRPYNYRPDWVSTLNINLVN